jgi:hypothetical protein
VAKSGRRLINISLVLFPDDKPDLYISYSIFFVPEHFTGVCTRREGEIDAIHQRW